MTPVLFNIRKSGMEYIRTTEQGYEVYAKGHWRALYDRENDRDMVRYMDETNYRTKRGLSQVIFNGRQKNDRW